MNERLGKSMKFTLDFNELQEADDGNTTYYGGTISVNGIVLRAHGSDRERALLHIIKAEVERQLGRKLTNEEELEHIRFLDGSVGGVESFEV